LVTKIDVALYCFLIKQVFDFMTPLLDDMYQGRTKEFTIEFPQFNCSSSLPSHLVSYDNQIWFPAIIYDGFIDGKHNMCYITSHYGLMKLTSALEIDSIKTDPVEYTVPADDFINDWKELFQWCEKTMEDNSDIRDKFYCFCDNPISVCEMFGTRDFSRDINDIKGKVPILCRICERPMESSSATVIDSGELEYYHCSFCKSSSYFPTRPSFTLDGWSYDIDAISMLKSNKMTSWMMSTLLREQENDNYSKYGNLIDYGKQIQLNIQKYANFKTYEQLNLSKEEFEWFFTHEYKDIVHNGEMLAKNKSEARMKIGEFLEENGGTLIEEEF